MDELKPYRNIYGGAIMGSDGAQVEPGDIAMLNAEDAAVYLGRGWVVAVEVAQPISDIQADLDVAQAAAAVVAQKLEEIEQEIPDVAPNHPPARGRRS